MSAALNILVVSAALIGIGFVLYLYTKQAKRYHRSILLLLTAIEQNDYSLRFRSGRYATMSRRETNRTLNRIKEILANARENAREQERFLSHIIDCIATGIFITDERGFVRYVNSSALELLSINVLTHLSALSRIDPDLPALCLRMESGQSQNLQIKKGNAEHTLMLKRSHIAIRGENWWIYTLNNIASELEAQETEAWIRLIRVMTHEIMNTVAPISSVTDTLRAEIKESNPDVSFVRSGLDSIAETVAELSAFVQNYRKFSGLPAPQRELTDLSARLHTVIRLFEPMVESAGLHLTQEIETLPLRYADSTQFTQALLNLLKNAAEADYPPDAPKHIRLRAYTSNDKVYIEIANNGYPISTDALPYIFVPFFTTKKQGSGVGLSLSRYILRLSGGNLYHSLSKDGYTTFTIEL